MLHPTAGRGLPAEERSDSLSSPFCRRQTRPCARTLAPGRGGTSSNVLVRERGPHEVRRGRIYEAERSFVGGREQACVRVHPCTRLAQRRTASAGAPLARTPDLPSSGEAGASARVTLPGPEVGTERAPDVSRPARCMLTARMEGTRMEAVCEEQARLYDAGDYVYPTDLPRRHLCRVTVAEEFNADGRTSQILKLEPMIGPWPPGTCLIRLNSAVIPAWRPSWRGPQARRPEALAGYRRKRLAQRRVG